MSQMILYHGQPNGPSLAVLAALAESGLEADCRLIDLLAGDRHTLPGITNGLARDMGIEGEGPVLVIDGEAMTESVFIAQFLDEVAGSGLQPADPFAHWQMLMWCRRITERCAPAAAWLGCQADAQARLAAMDDTAFAAITDAIASEDLRARWTQIRDGDFPDAATQDSKAKVAAAITMVEEQLTDGREWLMGDFSIADLETFAWLAGTAEIEPDAFAAAPCTNGWLARLRARPSVIAALARATVENPLRTWAPGPEINRWG